MFFSIWNAKKTYKHVVFSNRGHWLPREVVNSLSLAVSKKRLLMALNAMVFCQGGDQSNVKLNDPRGISKIPNPKWFCEIQLVIYHKFWWNFDWNTMFRFGHYTWRNSHPWESRNEQAGINSILRGTWGTGRGQLRRLWSLQSALLRKCWIIKNH